MNRHFLEFWGKALLQAAKSQQHLEDLANWTQRGFIGFQDYTKLFKAAYGLEDVKEDSPDFFNLWRKAEKDFRESFREYLNLLGMVLREEYDSLARKCEELKEKVAEQEETLKHLRTLLDEKGLGMEATTVEFQNLVKKQGEQFQKFIKGLGESLKPEKPGD
ncbi:MAG: hypothetical protein FJ134_01720 [Deltaproteobacteria bacterium]|nr:hypothetical protein [Deltaproteobacteria bacterium]